MKDLPRLNMNRINWIFKVILLLIPCIYCMHSMQIPLRSKRAADVIWQNNNLHGHVEKGYYIEVLMGTPPQALNILIDTGSSNFAVAGSPDPLIDKYYSSDSSTLKNLTNPDISIRYTEGFWKGRVISDLVSIPQAGLNQTIRMTFADIISSEKFFIEGAGWQGILGMGYTELVRPDNSGIKSFMQIAVEKTSMKNMFSLQLCMADVDNFNDTTGGTMIIGDYDRKTNTDDIYWTKIVHEWYYEVRVLGMRVGNYTVSLDCQEFNNDKSIVDSGTTNLHLPGKVFNKVVELIKSHLEITLPNFTVDTEFWAGKTALCWNPNQDPYSLFPILTIFLPSESASRTISLSLHPRHYLLYYGRDITSPEKVCYKFGLSTSTTGTVLGAVLMEEYVVIFDRENTRIGFAKSDCSITSTIHDLPGYPNKTSCAYISTSLKLGPLQITMYVLLGLIVLCALPACVLFCIWCYSKEKDADIDDTSILLDNSPK